MMNTVAPSMTDVAQAAKHVELIVELHNGEIASDQLARLAELRLMIRMLDDEDNENSLIRVMRSLEEQLAQRTSRRSAAAAAAVVVVASPVSASAGRITGEPQEDCRSSDGAASSVPSSTVQTRARENRHQDPTSIPPPVRDAQDAAEVGSAHSSEVHPTRVGVQATATATACGHGLRNSAPNADSRSSSTSAATVDPDPALEWRGSCSTMGTEMDDGVGSSPRSPRPLDRAPRSARDTVLPATTTTATAASTPSKAVVFASTVRDNTHALLRETGTRGAAAPIDASSQAIRPLWRPSVIALQADPPPPPMSSPDVPVKHRICLLLRTVMHKPSGFKEKDEAMSHQGHYCKGCLCPLRPTFRAMRLGKSWDSAKFCYYTGYYYCKDCHPCSEMSVIPARVLNYWDFTPLSVCSDAKSFLELQFEVPLLCVSAVNPKLYDVLPVLRMARSLRLQLNILREIGWTCPQFQKEFFGQDIARQAAVPQHKPRDRNSGGSDEEQDGEAEMATTVDEMIQLSGRRVHRAQAEAVAHRIPYGKRYLVEDSEFWSLSDLCEIKDVEDYVQRSDLDEMKRRKELWAVDAQGKIAGTSSTFSRFRPGGNGGDPSASGPAASTTTATSSSSPSSPAPGGGGGANATLRALMGGTPLNSYNLSSGDAFGASSGDAAALPPGEAYLTMFLKNTRSHMVRHVVQLCRQGTNCCFQRAARICPICKKKEFVYLFDLNRTRTCTRCHSCYHRECWQRRKGHHTACVVCAEKTAASGAGVATTAVASE